MTRTWLLYGAPVAFAAGLLSAHCSSSSSTGGYSLDAGFDGGHHGSSHTTGSGTSKPGNSSSVTSSSVTSSTATSSASVPTSSSSYVDAGVDSSSASTGSTASTSGNSTSSSSTGTSASTGGSSSSSGPTCYTVATKTYPEDGGSMYCPFSAVDGGKNVFCPHGQHCCETPESTPPIPSTCEPSTTACPVANSTDWQCEGTPDCSSGQVCCGAGKVENQAAQPGCGPDGGTVPPSIFVSKFTPGSTCAATCVAVGTGAVAWQICSQTSECPAGQTCVPVEPKGNTIGACCTGSAGSWTCTFVAGSGTGTGADSGS